MTLSRALCIGALFAASLPPDAFAARITSPAPGTPVTSGGTVLVVVAPSPGETLAEVVFATSAGVTEVPVGTFQAQVSIPVDAIGAEYIVAYVKLASGKVSIPSVRVTANPGPLEHLTASGPPVMDYIGQLVQLEVAGAFADGVSRDLTHGERGTTYSSTNAGVLQVHATGVLQARSRGVAQVLVSSHGKSAVVTVVVNVPNPPDNRIPVPNAGPDIVVAPETFVRLNGEVSSDPDGDAIEYGWQQESGPAVMIRDQESARPSFISPRVTVATVLEFSVVVKDGKRAMSFPDIVRVTVTP